LGPRQNYWAPGGVIVPMEGLSGRIIGSGIIGPRAAEKKRLGSQAAGGGGRPLGRWARLTVQGE
jgi:hypothetical protein